MNRRFTRASIAMVLAIAAPAGAARAVEPPTAAAPAAPAATASPSATDVSTTPAQPAGSSTQPAKPAPLPEPKITQAQAEAAVSELFKLPQPSDTLELQWNLSQNGTKWTWDLQVTVRQGNSASGSTLATVDAVTGRILRYRDYNIVPTPVRTGPLTAVRTEAEAKARAWALIQQVAPEKAAVLKELPAGTGDYNQKYDYGYGAGPNGLGDTYNFMWAEYHDGVPFPASSVSVSVHKQTLDYVSVNVNLIDSVKFQPGPAKVTAADALKFWQAETKPDLGYQPVRSLSPYPSSRPTGYRLIYSFGNLSRPVDAITGTWGSNPNPYPALEGDTKLGQPEAVPAGSVAPVVPQALPLTATEARKLAAAVLEVPDTADLRSEHGFHGFPGDEPTIGLNFWNNDANASIEFTPKTGLIRSANRSHNMQTGTSSPANPQAAKPTAEQEAQAKQAAIAVMQAYYSTLRDQVKLESMPQYGGPDQAQVRRFRFARYMNGIALPSDTVSVTIDLASMKWQDLNANWTAGITAPDPGSAIAPEAAQASIMAGQQPQLTYQPVYRPMSKEEMATGNRAPELSEAALSYILMPQATLQLDALTGKPVSADGLSIADIEAGYKQVLGHPAEGELQFLLSRRVLRADELKPDAALTRAQAVMLLLNRNQRMSFPIAPVTLPYTDVPDTDSAYGSVRTAWQEGWLRPLGDEKTFRPDTPVTRAEFAVWAARAVGFGELARSELSVTSGYKDLNGVTGEQRNAINFLQALKLAGAADAFRPNDPLTQAEGAALTARIYNYLLAQNP